MLLVKAANTQVSYKRAGVRGSLLGFISCWRHLNWVYGAFAHEGDKDAASHGSAAAVGTSAVLPEA